jgi:hypothetical protein
MSGKFTLQKSLWDKRYDCLYLRKAPFVTVNKEICVSWVWWCVSIIPALRRLRQEDQEFQGSLGYIARDHLGYIERHSLKHKIKMKVIYKSKL